MSIPLLPFIMFTLIVVQFIIISEQFYLPLEDRIPLNNRPIIGILAQELSYGMKNHYSTNRYDSYIVASYVKFIEGAGARVVPIWIGQNEQYYQHILHQINGVLWPGGAASFNNTGGYADAGYLIYKIAQQMNRNDDYFPILGICLGFELLTYIAAKRTEHRQKCYSMNEALPLEFASDFRKSGMFNNTSSDIINILKTKNVTSNFHRYCLTENKLKNVNISHKFRILSYNYDENKIRFISSLEHVNYPFYGLQFHPEKNLYEWIIGKRIPHGQNATKISQYFANFFVNEARKNNHAFESEVEETSSLIYNYPVTYTGLKNSSFVQTYIFEKKKEKEKTNNI